MGPAPSPAGTRPASLARVGDPMVSGSCEVVGLSPGTQRYRPGEAGLLWSKPRRCGCEYSPCCGRPHQGRRASVGWTPNFELATLRNILEHNTRDEYDQLC